MSTSGPLFNGRLAASVEAATRRTEYRIADEGVALVRNNIRISAKRRTGRYERSLRTTRQASSVRVTDGGVVYGPWLEGVSRRNSSTRFKGYRQFRKATQELERRAKPIAEVEISRAIGGA